MSKKYGALGERGFLAWMDGYCEAFDDLPDGARQVACEGAVEHYNNEHKTQLDPFDGWMHWIEARSTK
jgi:hypothetical protein